MMLLNEQGICVGSWPDYQSDSLCIPLFGPLGSPTDPVPEDVEFIRIIKDEEQGRPIWKIRNQDVQKLKDELRHRAEAQQILDGVLNDSN